MPALDLSQLSTPTPTQQKFFDAIRDAPEMGLVAYIGSLGSGKTWGLCQAAIGLSLTYPGIRILLGRYHSTDLRDTTQTEFFKCVAEIEDALPKDAEGRAPSLGDWQKEPNNFAWANGALTMFRSLDQAEVKYKSLEIACFGIDEASELSEASGVMMLMARRRQAGMPHVGFLVSNPTGQDHWLYDWFVARPKTGFVHFRTNTLENLAHLPTNYVESLRESYPEDWIRRYLEGEWGYLAKGRPVFPGFVSKAQIREVGWTKYRPVHVGIDWGYRAPGVVWTQLDKEDRLRVLRSWVPREIRADHLAEGLIERNGRWFPGGDFCYYAGHDGVQKRDTSGKSAKDVFEAYGLFPRLRYTHVERGLTILRRLCDLREDGEPGMLLDPANARLIEGFQGGYQYPAERPGYRGKDEPQKDGLFDPLMDALRYVVIHLFTPAGTPPTTGRIAAFGRRSRRAKESF